MAKLGVIVVGAGIGGLAAAMLLAARGFDVTVLEKDEVVGGKMRQMTIAGRHIDAGPTVITMKHVFDQLFDDCGMDLRSAVELRKADVLARHAWSETETLDLYADTKRSADAVGRLAGAAAARGFIEFTEHARRVFETMDPLFMQAARPTPISMARNAGLAGLRGLVSSAPFTTLWDLLGRYFSDPRLRQLFGRYATYCGSSPFESPATLALIAHVELGGVWLVEGGIGAFGTAVGQAASSAGAIIRTGAEVAEIVVNGGRAKGVRLTSGEVIVSDAVVANCDVGALAGGRLGASARAAVASDVMLPRSLSAATWGFVARAEGMPLNHHSVFFSRSSEREFGDLFTRRRVPEDPTVYVCAQDRSDARAPSEPSERLFVIVNAPADAGASLSRQEEVSACRTALMRTLARCGLHLSVEAEEHVGPSTFAHRFPGTDGALYGMASHGWAASFRRMGARSKLRGLYLAGGSVHPGAGLPMAALSGRAAALALMADMAST